MFAKALLQLSLLFVIQQGHAAPAQPVSAARNRLSGGSQPPLSYITLEEHFDSQSLLSYQSEDATYDLFASLLGLSTDKTLRNLSIRIPDMDANGIKLQVLAQDPQPYALAQPDAISKANEQLAKAISGYPDRFRGFCFLPMAYPDLAVEELNRCVSEYGFLGAMVDGHLMNNTYYDGKEYDILWSTFVELDVPMYLHPTYPKTERVNGTGGLYAPDHSIYTDAVAADVGAAGWGWHSDNGLGFVKMWLGGVFDRHPDLKIVLGHMGEMVPYMLARIDYSLGYAKPRGITVMQAWERNIWVTTAGFFSLVPFRTLKAATAVDRIMYSVDYPWAQNANGTTFMEELKSSGLVSQADWNAIAFGNAEKLLKL